MWATRTDVTPALWPDGAGLVTRDPGALDTFLEAAHDACAEYAPALDAGAPVPARYRLAVILHARDLYNASRRSAEDTIGADGYAAGPRPLSLDVRQLLRPRSPRPRFGRRPEATA